MTAPLHLRPVEVGRVLLVMSGGSQGEDVLRPVEYAP